MIRVTDHAVLLTPCCATWNASTMSIRKRFGRRYGPKCPRQRRRLGRPWAAHQALEATP